MGENIKIVKEMECVLVSYNSGQGPVAGFCEDGTEPSGFIKDVEFLDQLSDN
jgi:hypothetical protein